MHEQINLSQWETWDNLKALLDNFASKGVSFPAHTQALHDQLKAMPIEIAGQLKGLNQLKDLQNNTSILSLTNQVYQRFTPEKIQNKVKTFTGTVVDFVEGPILRISELIDLLKKPLYHG